MCLFATVLFSLLSWISFVEAEPVVCLLREKMQGCPPDEKGFEPVICTQISTKENITCYPDEQALLFGTQRIMCHPFIRLSTGNCDDCPACAPLSEAIGLQNSQGIAPIKCQMMIDKTIITCYPDKKVTFPSSGGFSCKPAEVDPFICSPISPSNGPPNFYGIPPINCQKIIDNSVVECYPNRRITFPAQCPDRILCFPIPPEAASTTAVTTTEAPSTCLPKDKFIGGVPNDQGINPIRCGLTNGSLINCFPPFNVTFPQQNPVEISCTPMPLTPPIVCVPNAGIPGAPVNSDGIPPIQCLTVQDQILVPCYTSYRVDFPQAFPTRVQCLTAYTC